jgi:hypothetical protein
VEIVPSEAGVEGPISISGMFIDIESLPPGIPDIGGIDDGSLTVEGPIVMESPPIIPDMGGIEESGALPMGLNPRESEPLGEPDGEPEGAGESMLKGAVSDRGS